MTSPTLRHTALHARHAAVGARLGDFNGWEMPIEYEGVLAEHMAVRGAAGVFDVSHLGTVFVAGPDALAVVAATFSNDPSLVASGSSQYTLCCDRAGGIIDDCIVYRLPTPVDGVAEWMVVPNAGNTVAVVSRLEAAAAERDATVSDESQDWAILAVQGPQALALAGQVLPLDPRDLPHLGVATFGVASTGLTTDTDQVDGVVCRTGYTGEPGCEVVVRNGVAGLLWDELLDAGAIPAGLGARDTLRLEMGYPLHGNDIGPDTTPYEARLGWAVKLERGDGASFTGQEALAAEKDGGPTRRLLGLQGSTRRPPRPGMTVSKDGVEVGTVRSGSFSPGLEVGIGLAYLDQPIGPGDTVDVDVRGTTVPFAVVRPPFVASDPRG